MLLEYFIIYMFPLLSEIIQSSQNKLPPPPPNADRVTPRRFGINDENYDPPRMLRKKAGHCFSLPLSLPWPHHPLCIIPFDALFVKRAISLTDEGQVFNAT